MQIYKEAISADGQGGYYSPAALRMYRQVLSFFSFVIINVGFLRETMAGQFSGKKFSGPFN